MSQPLTRLSLMFAVIAVAGVAVGVFTGRVLAGDSEGPPATRSAELPAIRDVLARMSLPFSQPQSKELNASQGGDVNSPTLPSNSQADPSPLPGTSVSPLAFSAQAEGSPPRFSQVSRQVSSSLGVSTSDPFLGDIDGSGVLDTADLLLLAGAVGTSPPDPAAADLNGDGRVDIRPHFPYG